jgi:LPXTG-motif cell wall-anchored protein
MENIQNNPPSTDSSGTNTVILTIVILALLALGVWFFVGRRPGAPAVPSTGTDNSGVNIDVNGTLPTGSGADEGPAGGQGNQNGS